MAAALDEYRRPDWRAPALTAYNNSYMGQKPKTEPSFEEGLEQLEEIVKQLEDGDLPLEKSIGLFEKGVKLSESSRKQLEQAEAKVEILLRKEGKVEAAPFELDDGEPGA